MGTDQATIVNLAAGELGDLAKLKRMTSFTRAGCGSSTALHVAFDFYQASKEQMLAALDWSRSRKIKALTVHADDPLDTKWAYKYVRPPDCLILRKIIDSEDTEYAWEEMNEERIVGETTFNDEYIYTDLDSAYARYTFDLSEVQYNVGMAQLHALYLAEHMAATVVGDNARALLIVQKLQARAERLCLALGAKEGYVADEQGAHELTDCF